jgi:phosphoglycerate dehydrogenase-like enzyme
MSLRLAIRTPVARASFERDLQGLGLRLQWPEAEGLPQAAAQADALVLPAADYTPALAEALTAPGCPCRWLQLLSAGYETLLAHGVPARVQVSNAGSVWSPVVAEHVMSLLLAQARRLPRVLAAQAQGRWDGTIRHDMGTLFDSQLLIIGIGSIGGEVARRARAFGMRVLGLSRSGRPHAEADAVWPLTRLHEALTQADHVVCALPGAPETDGLIGARELAACKPGAVLCNVGRGTVIDSVALLQALQAGRVAAVLDVTEPEPLPDAHPLWGLPNAIVSPHLGGAAPPRYYDRLVRLVVANLQRHLAGESLNDSVRLAT